jgi:hypothetical protein
MIRDLAHVVDREKAKIGVFITLAEPTKPMRTEAVKVGYYETSYGKYPKIQILTIRELFEDPFFTGREQILVQLQEALADRGRAATSACFFGPSGGGSLG